MTTKAVFRIIAAIGAALAIPAASGASLRLDPGQLGKFVRTENGLRVIHLPKGTYDLPATLELPSDTVLEGEGEKTVLRPGEPFHGSRLVTNSAWKTGNRNITVRSLSFEVDASLFPGDSPGILRFENVEGLVLVNLALRLRSRLYGIDLASGCRNVLVEGCSIVNRGEGGCVMVRNRNVPEGRAARNIRVSGNRLSSGKVDEPLAVFGWQGVVRDVHVDRNRVEASGASFGITAYGIDRPGHTGSLSGVRIRGNEIRGGNVGAIGVKGGAAGISVRENRISSAHGDGIFLHAGGADLPPAREVEIRGNVIEKAGRHGIFATGQSITVEGNRVRDCGKAGIYAGDEVTVISNDIANASPGILVDGTRDRVVRGNRTRNAPIRVLGKGSAGISGNVEE